MTRALVDRHAGDRVFEVGNVLSHYGRQSHRAIDKYERAPGVLNRDVLDLDGFGPFDLIVAISMLEHVGTDERPAAPGKAVQAIQALRGLLASEGRLVLTVPVGYNPAFDAALRGEEIPVSGAAAMRAPAAGRDACPEDAWPAPYDFLLYRARGVAVRLF